MTQKIALVTGASRGLGAALAVALAPSHHVVAVARTTGALEELDDRIKAVGGQATLAPMDITDVNATAHLFRSIFDRWGQLDVWAHTAIHAAPLTPTNHIDTKDWTKTLAINVEATGNLIPMVSPLLKDGGRAIFFDDAARNAKFHGAYGASKAAQIALAQSWQAEVGENGVRVIIDTPAPMPTATRARFHPGEDRAKLADPAAQAARILAAL